ncbi:interleukin-22 receptor subunit alpha-1 [Rhinatrema bivittatum]|uniref:interleukin-22 receptor subunit alpha-1 n=1 Tax=Rhinatrema bivittatum TaxID=194408 RepID=UPI00112C2EAD|nr:interleukin-22 receptor subunit alpha-1 [Rhinatrema bivittatum]
MLNPSESPLRGSGSNGPVRSSPAAQLGAEEKGRDSLPLLRLPASDWTPALGGTRDRDRKERAGQWRGRSLLRKQRAGWHSHVRPHYTGTPERPLPSMKSAALLLWALCFWLGHASADCLPQVKNVTFRSLNFVHVLHWEAVSQATAYSVQYKKYGESKWVLKNDCQNITKMFCNLTSELDDLSEQYIARVTAVTQDCASGWVDTKRFSPKETVFGRPALSYVAGVRSVKFLIQPTYIPLRSKTDGHQLTVESIYGYDLLYHLTVSKLRTHKQWTMTKKGKEIDVVSLEPDTDYNGTAFFSIPKTGEKSKERAFLVRTLPDTTWLQLFLGGLAFSLVLLVLIICYMGYKYVRHQGPQPKSLDFNGLTSFQPMNPAKGQPSHSCINGFSSPGHFISAALPPGLTSAPMVPQPLAVPGNAYKSQTVHPQPTFKPSDPKDESPAMYRSQFQEKYSLKGSCKTLRSAYGVCAEVASPAGHRSYRPNQGLADTLTDGLSLAEVNAEQYQRQTLILPDGSPEGHPSMNTKRLDGLPYQQQRPQEPGFPFHSGRLVLPPERENGELHLPLLMSLLVEGMEQSSHRPLKVEEDWRAEGGLDEQLHSLTGTRGELLDGREGAFSDSLAQPFQYQSREPRTVTEQLRGAQSHPQSGKSEALHSYRQSNPPNAEPFFWNLYLKLHREQ